MNNYVYIPKKGVYSLCELYGDSNTNDALMGTSQIDEEILTLNGVVKINEVYKRNSVIYLIETEDKSRILIDRDMKLFTPDGYVELYKLKVGSKVKLARGMSCYGPRQIFRDVEITPDIAEALGDVYSRIKLKKKPFLDRNAKLNLLLLLQNKWVEFMKECRLPSLILKGDEEVQKQFGTVLTLNNVPLKILTNNYASEKPIIYVDKISSIKQLYSGSSYTVNADDLILNNFVVKCTA